MNQKRGLIFFPTCLVALCLIQSFAVPALAVQTSELEARFNRYMQSLKLFETVRAEASIKWVLSPISSPKTKRLGAVIISTGRTESRLSWYEYAERLGEVGYDVIVVEHRGQGLSHRSLSDPQINHIENFEDYILDFDQVLDDIKKSVKGPYFILASSMGGAISILSPRAQEAAAGYVMNAPMFQIRPKSIPIWFAKALSWLLSSVGLEKLYAPPTGPFNPNSRFEDNLYAHSRERYEFLMKQLRERKEFQVGGPSVQWIREALKTPERLKTALEKNQLVKPVLILQAGEENFVDNQSQDEFCAAMPACRIEHYSQARHVIHMENDDLIESAFQTTVEYFAQLPRAVPTAD